METRNQATKRGAIKLPCGTRCGIERSFDVTKGYSMQLLTQLVFIFLARFRILTSPLQCASASVPQSGSVIMSIFTLHDFLIDGNDTLDGHDPESATLLADYAQKYPEVDDEQTSRGSTSRSTQETLILHLKALGRLDG